MKNLLKIVLLTSVTFAFGQDFSGKAEYQTKRIFKESKTEETGKSEMDKETMDALKEAMKKSFEKKYTLTFNKNEALFEEIKELETPKPQGGIVMVTVSASGDGDKYINLKDKTYIEEEDMFGEEYLIKDSLQKKDWKILEETKKIGDYTCNKAEYVLQVTPEEQADYDAYLKKSKDNKTEFYKRDAPQARTFIAWFTTEIPVSVGPNGNWGLPGLILEFSGDEMIYLCTSINIKKEKTTIRIPKTGKKVTRKEYEKFQKKMEQQMEDNNGVFLRKN